MEVGKYKLVISNNFNGCIVVCSDSLAGLKEGYYEVKLSKLDKIHQANGLVEAKVHPYVIVNDAVLGSHDVLLLRSDSHNRWYGNHHWQITVMDTAFHYIKDHTPEFFDKSLSKTVKVEDVKRSSLKIIFDKMQDLKFGLKEIPDPLTRIALFEFATLAGLPISDDTVITRHKQRHYLLDHEMKVIL